jgi:hypothetical protein
VIVRRNRAAYPASGSRAISVHDDLMVVYPQEKGLRADYYDSEGHVIRYSIQTPDGSRAVFMSDVQAGSPRYRLTYTLSDGKLNGRFEVAPPDAPDAFRPYLSWTSHRAAKREAKTDTPARNYEGVVDRLRKLGFRVDAVSEISPPFFTASGRLVSIEGSDLQIFEYPDEDAALVEAGRVACNGHAVGTEMVAWVAAPHFFRKGKLLAVYLGSNKQVLGTLREVFGPQFAGES